MIDDISVSSSSCLPANFQFSLKPPSAGTLLNIAISKPNAFYQVFGYGQYFRFRIYGAQKHLSNAHRCLKNSEAQFYFAVFINAAVSLYFYWARKIFKNGEGGNLK